MKTILAFFKLTLTFITVCINEAGSSSHSYAVDIFNLEGLALADLENVIIFQKILKFGIFTETTNEKVRELIKEYIKDFESGTGISAVGLASGFSPEVKKKKVKRITDNPIAAYRLIGRLVKLWPDLHRKISGLFQLQKLGLHLLDPKSWPDKEDFAEALNGLLRLQFMYNLNTAQLADGKISGRSTGVNLDMMDMIGIGMYADRLNYHALAIEWLELAWRNAKSQENAHFWESNVQEQLEIAVNNHDEAYEKAKPGDFATLFRHPIRIRDPDGSFSRQRNPDRRKFIVESQLDLGKDRYLTYKRLCSGSKLQTPEQKAKLFCWYESHDKYLRIGPMKMELLSRNPDIVQIYQVIGDQMIERLMNESKKGYAVAQLSRPSKIQEQQASISEHEKKRVKLFGGRKSMFSWIDDHSLDSPVAKLSWNIRALTGLNSIGNKFAEMLQVASYSFTGYFRPHSDALYDASESGAPGNRIATFMYYLSDVAQGGFTAFTDAGVAARPIRGSAVFWLNIFGNESADVALHHGACPVLFGRKFVATKWIRLYGQFQKWKCPTQCEDQRFRVRVNGKSLR